MGRATSHSNSDLCTIVNGELAAIPRGHFYQNMYRMVHEQARLNGPGRQDQPAGTDAAVLDFALRTVRDYQPDFVPVPLG